MENKIETSLDDYKLMLKTVEKALKKDSIENILKYDEETHTAKMSGICGYLSRVIKVDVLAFKFLYVSYVLTDWLCDMKYILRINTFIYEEYTNWDKRLRILREFKEFLIGKINEIENKENNS